MENLEPYLDKFSESGRRVLESAFDETRRRNQYYISPEHILYALITEENELFDTTMRNLSIDPQNMRCAVETRLENSFHYEGKGIRFAPETTEIFKYSMDKARSDGRRVIGANDICFVLAAGRHSLLDDILHNPESSISTFKKSRIATEEKQNYFPPQLQNKPSSFPQLQNEPSKFFTEFSLNELVKKNNSPTGLLFAKRGSGGCSVGSSRQIAGQTNHSQHETSNCWMKNEDLDEFNEQEFIASLKKDVENDIRQNGLKITKSDISNLSRFCFEYGDDETQGKIEIFGTMKNDCYELQANSVEKNN